MGLKLFGAWSGHCILNRGVMRKTSIILLSILIVKCCDIQSFLQNRKEILDFSKNSESLQFFAKRFSSSNLSTFSKGITTKPDFYKCLSRKPKITASTILWNKKKPTLNKSKESHI